MFLPLVKGRTLGISFDKSLCVLRTSRLQFILLPKEETKSRAEIWLYGILNEGVGKNLPEFESVSVTVSWESLNDYYPSLHKSCRGFNILNAVLMDLMVCKIKLNESYRRLNEFQSIMISFN